MKGSSGSDRSALGRSKRVVVKVGSRYLAEGAQDRFANVARQLAESSDSKRKFVLVSSGAVALGWQRLGLTRRPRAVARLQAAAAAGQSQLMRLYEQSFGAHDLTVAQVLLTHGDLANRDRYLNARSAVDALLDLGAIPIINENDAVSVDEIQFGDNDQLAAMVATLVGADLLILLTDVEGVLDGQGQRVTNVERITDVRDLVRPNTSSLGLGGMASKLDAAGRAALHGVAVVIAHAGRADVVRSILAGDDVGTYFRPYGSRVTSRKHWIGYTLRPRGAIVVDSGAAEALIRKNRSLLPAGVLGVRGDFAEGDAVSIMSVGGVEVARGLSRYAVADACRLAGARTSQIEQRLGRRGPNVIVHRDDLVVTDPSSGQK